MAATIQELRAGCPGADDGYILSQLEQQADLKDAQAEWNMRLVERVKHLEGQLASAGKQTAKPGVESLGTSGRSAAASESGDFVALVRELKRSGLGHTEAVARVCREHPDLHEAFVRSQNRQTGRVQDLIGERFALA